jgi:hypothetical protein
MQNIAAIPKGIMRKRTEADQIHFREWRPLTHFRLYIETTAWEKGRFLNKGLDSLCRYLLAAAFVCFLSPVVLLMVK